ncbi:MAG: polysaccharide deacetylase family protein [Candidatus Aenigmarchaeota archaeon]|nr:polysaccharide deacetylase family protein [Candidatus Aenigmarchaeota archaeon]
MEIRNALVLERLLSIFLCHTGLLSLYMSLKRSRTVILTYHRIRPDEATGGGEAAILSKGNFERHISYLSKHYDIISLADFVRLAGSGKRPPRKSVVLTFDDGYKDNRTNAYPVLKRHDVPATIFLISGRIGSEGFLSSKDIREMSGLVDFGAHTASHAILADVSLSEAKREIEGSKHDLEKLLKKEVKLFSYPSGGSRDYNDVVKRLVREAGFDCAVTTMNGDNGPDSDMFELRRIGMSHENSFTVFRVKSSGMLNSMLRIMKGRMSVSVSGHVKAGK